MLPELESAIEEHRQGRLDVAEAAYQFVLRQDPESADALHLLGVIAHQRGNHLRAVRLIERAIAVNPLAAAFLNNLGEAHRALGNLQQAADCCRQALVLQPVYADARNNLGLCLLASGEHAQAEAEFRSALRSRPDFAMAWNNLGHALRERGQTAEAVASYRRAVQLDPQLPHAHNNLGQILLEEGEIDEAYRHCREAIRLAPTFAEAHGNLGNVLREQDRLEEAKRSYAEALRLNPRLAMVHNNMGQALQEQGSLEEALGWYRQALELEPDSPRFHSNLASALAEQEELDRAIRHYQRAIELDADYAEAHNGLGHTLEERGRYESAIACYREAIRRNPDLTAARTNLAQVHVQLGESDRSYACCREALARDPDAPGAYSTIATHHTDRFTANDESEVQRILAGPYLGDGQQALLHHALAHVLDARAEYADAAKHMRQANQCKYSMLKRRGERYDPHAHSRFVDELIETFAGTDFHRVAGWGAATTCPVFVFGLPRSGTTLTEQILASHHQVHGAGELSLARDGFESLPALQNTDAPPSVCLRDVAAEGIQHAAQTHLDRLRQMDGNADRIVDKMPDNYLYLGWIVSLFPNARFIHCRRDVRDVALSCWITNFKTIRWACDPQHIAARIDDYRRLMIHWRQVLPVPMLEIDYEETVADLEGVARRLLDWLELPWDQRCLAFHQTQRPIRTASVTQVRRPVHSRSVGRWKNYRDEMESLFPTLCDRHSSA